MSNVSSKRTNSSASKSQQWSNDFNCRFCDQALDPSEAYAGYHEECQTLDNNDPEMDMYIAENWESLTMTFGKHKHTLMTDMLKRKDTIDYVFWVLNCRGMWYGHKRALRYVIGQCV